MTKLFLFSFMLFANMAMAQGDFGIMCGNQFRPISQNEIHALYRNLLGHSNQVVLQFTQVQSYTDGIGKVHYFLKTNGTEGESMIDIRTPVTYINGKYLLADDTETCQCKSTNCSAWGCNASIVGGCSCSPCGNEDGKCEKTSGIIKGISSMYCQ